MENKYYTPKIEEFHVGFTYEMGKDYLGEYLWTEMYIDHADGGRKFQALQDAGAITKTGEIISIEKCIQVENELKNKQNG